jgi:methylmalonyl-CoA carboxyltransferase large subunit
MSIESTDRDRLAEALEALRSEVAALSRRVLDLEAASAKAPPAPAASAPAAAEPALAGEALALVIGAAVAAYLGKRAHVRQIRLLGSAAWAQQGRVTIQASHAISSNSGRSWP